MDEESTSRPGPETLRILFVPWDRFPPFRPAARVIFLNYLPGRGHRVDWLIQADESRPARNTTSIQGGYAYVGATDPGRRAVNRLRKHLLNFRNACRMVSLVRRNRYDVIQAKDNFSAAIIGLLVARLYRIRFFYWIAFPRAEASLYEARTGTARYPWLYRLRGHVFTFLLYRIILRGADHVFVQSEQMKSDIAAHGIRTDAMTPVLSSVDLDRIPYASASSGVDLPAKGAEKWVLYLGTLSHLRRLDFVVRAFAPVLDEEPQAVLVLVGKGDHESDLRLLRDEAERLGIAESVRFPGHMDMERAWEYVRQADVCLSPYYPAPILKSTSPTKLVEYMAMAKAVVANDHPEQTIVLEESGGGLCVPWDERAFADAVIRLLRNPAERAAMGERGRRYVERHRTNRAMGELVERTYRRVVGSST